MNPIPTGFEATDMSPAIDRPWVVDSPGRELLRAGVLLGLGLVLPWVCHRLAPEGFSTGPVLMPLMIPVILGAFLLPVRSALAVACGLPLLSFMASGMPPFNPPVAPQLMLEGCVTILAIRVTLNNGARPWWLAMAAGVAANRLSALICEILLFFAGPAQPVQAMLWQTARGIPGLLLGWALLPPLFRLFRAPDRRS